MFKINDIVDIKNTNLTGRIIRKNLSNKGVFFTIKTIPSNINITVDENDIITSTKIFESSKKNNVTLNICLNNSSEENEIMLRHQTVEVAIENLDRFIYSSICTKQKRIKIIHGRHGGILRKAVSEYLKSSPYVESYHIADCYEGGYGVTIANLK